MSRLSFKYVWLPIALFTVLQVGIVFFASNGPFVDESSQAVAGMRVWQGYGITDAYLTWFAGSPFLWSPLSALGFWLGGLEGSRLVALLFSLITLLAFAKATANLFDDAVAVWAVLTFGLNGLFVAFAHFAVYDTPAFAGITACWWLITEYMKTHRQGWLVGAALAFVFGTLAKYQYGLMGGVFCALLLVHHWRERKMPWPDGALFLGVSGLLLSAYGVAFGNQLMGNTDSVFSQQLSWFSYGREFVVITIVQALIVPITLALLGWIVTWRRQPDLKLVVLGVAWFIWPMIHITTSSYISYYKHILLGLVFAYPFIGVLCHWLWTSSRRFLVPLLIAVLFLLGREQWLSQEYWWYDMRPVANDLMARMQKGEQVLADSNWNYILYLYAHGLIDTPRVVHNVGLLQRRGVDLCQVKWIVSEQDGEIVTSGLIKEAVNRCGHQEIAKFVLKDSAPDRNTTGDGVLMVSLYDRDLLRQTIWRMGTPIPQGRHEAQGAVVGSQLYVLGGFSSRTGVVTSRVDVYDLKQNSWSRAPDLPEPVTHMGVAVAGTKIFLAGGFVGNDPGHEVDQVWQFDTITQRWSALPPLPAKRGGGAMALLNRELHFFAGSVREGQRTIQKDFGDHWMLDLDQATGWRTAAPLPMPRNHLGAVALDGKIYAVGGQFFEFEKAQKLAVVHEYDPATDRWREVASLPKPLANIVGSTFVWDERLLVVGGATDQYITTDVFEYDPQRDAWQVCAPIPSQRFALVAAVIDEQLIVTSGLNQVNIDPETQTWLTTRRCR